MQPTLLQHQHRYQLTLHPYPVIHHLQITIDGGLAISTYTVVPPVPSSEREKDAEPQKHPGQWIPNHSPLHYQPKICILKKQIDSNGNEQGKCQIIVLRIDFMKPSLNERNQWIKYNGLWLFRVSILNQTKDVKPNYEHLLRDTVKMDNCHSQQCLTLNAAAKLFHQHLRHEMYENCAKLAWSHNVMNEQDDVYEIL